MAVGKTQLIAQIAQASGVSVIEAQKLCEGKTQAQLEEMLSIAISGKVIEYSTEFEHTIEKPIQSQSPIQETPELSEAQTKDLTIQFLSQNVQDVIGTVSSMDNGLVSKGYDALKNLFETRTSSSNVDKVLNNEITALDFLMQANDGNLTKKEYYEQNRERLKQIMLARLQSKDGKTGFDYLDKFAPKSKDKEKLLKLISEEIDGKIALLEQQGGIDTLKQVQRQMMLTDESIIAPELDKLIKSTLKNNTKGIEGQQINFPPPVKFPEIKDAEKPMKLEEVFQIERGIQYDKESIEIFQQKKGEMAVATSAFNKVQSFKAASNNLIENDKSASDVVKLFEDYYHIDKNLAKENLEKLIKKQDLDIFVKQNEEGEISLEFGERYKDEKAKNRALNSLLLAGNNAQDEKLKQVLGGKTLEDYANSYQSSYQFAFGARNAQDLANAMKEDNQTIIDTTTQVATYGGMGLMVVGGILTITPLAPLGATMASVGGKVALTGIAAKNIAGLTEAYTRENVSDEEVTRRYKDLALDVGGLLIGGAAGRQGLKIATNMVNKGSNALVATIAEKGTDFTLSAIGDLAMMGAMGDDLSHVWSQNGVGIIVSTLTGVQTSKALFKNASDIKLGHSTGIAALNTNKSNLFNKTLQTPEQEIRPQHTAKVKKIEPQIIEKQNNDNIAPTPITNAQAPFNKKLTADPIVRKQLELRKNITLNGQVDMNALSEYLLTLKSEKDTPIFGDSDVKNIQAKISGGASVDKLDFILNSQSPNGNCRFNAPEILSLMDKLNTKHEVETLNLLSGLSVNKKSRFTNDEIFVLFSKIKNIPQLKAVKEMALRQKNNGDFTYNAPEIARTVAQCTFSTNEQLLAFANLLNATDKDGRPLLNTIYFPNIVNKIELPTDLSALNKIMNIKNKQNYAYTNLLLQKAFDEYKAAPTPAQQKAFVLTLSHVEKETPRFSINEASEIAKINIKNDDEVLALNMLLKKSPTFSDIKQIMTLIAKNNLSNDDVKEIFDAKKTPRNTYWTYDTDEIKIILTSFDKNSPNKLLFANKAFEALAKNVEVGKMNLSKIESNLVNDKISNLSYLLEDEIKDPVIKQEVENKLSSLQNQSDFALLLSELETITTLVDAYKMATNQSYGLSGSGYKYIKELPESKKRNTSQIISNSLDIEKQNAKAHNETPYTTPALIKNALETDALKQYIKTQSKKNAAMSNHLYETYYLPRLELKNGELCKKINDEFNIKLFIEDESSPLAPQLVYNELSQWRTASNGAVKTDLIPIIDLGKIDPYYQKHINVIGYNTNTDNSVFVKGESASAIRDVLIHELAHANDNTNQYFGIINGINFDEIAGYEMVPKLDAQQKPMLNADGTQVMTPKMNNGNIVFYPAKSKYYQEFTNGGLTHWNLGYAHTNKKEFLAVAMQGDFTKYSPEFKETLIKLGLPQWVFNRQTNAQMYASNMHYDPTKLNLNLPEAVQFNINHNVEHLFNQVKQNSADIIETFDKTFGAIRNSTTSSRVKTEDTMIEKAYRNFKKQGAKSEKISKQLNAVNLELIRIEIQIKTNEAKNIAIDKGLIQQKIKLSKQMDDLNIDLENTTEKIKTLSENYSAMKNSLSDATGNRIILNDASARNIDAVVKKLIEGIENDQFIVTTVENYASSNDRCYFTETQLNQIKEACKKKGIITEVNYGAKASGYTSTQMNVIYKDSSLKNWKQNGVVTELQIRGKEINATGEAEHYVYDIKEGKDLLSNVQNEKAKDKLTALYEAVEKVYPKNSKTKTKDSKQYERYIQKYYMYQRDVEMRRPAYKPNFPSNLPKALDMDNLIEIYKILHP